MGNNTTESKLDEAVKNTLSNYEGKFDAGDWSRMESMLNAAPKSSNMSWSKPLSIIIGIVVIGGSILIYKHTGSSTPAGDKSTETSVTVTPTSEKVKAAPSITSTPPPSVTKTESVVSTPPSLTKEQPVLNSPDTKEKTIVAPVVKTTESIKTNSKDIASTEKVTVKEKNKKDKAKQNVSVMGNTPIFGDMIDSSKGVIHETKEKEGIKKAAVKTSGTPIGWGLLNQNMDSLRKQQEKMKKDSVK